jgi:predicted 3-demethylubiquinone-9 3-methyltransferase (glyoxalase superfamily)
MIPKNTICLWYDGTALDAAKFYAETFPDSAVGTVHRAPGDQVETDHLWNAVVGNGGEDAVG